ncbi:MAG: hypothetical protein ISR77_36610 [Pirellulaceae bacterium]|nr:hypothetical protein [Pirellulaceae bacterium]
MGFLSGSMTFECFRISSTQPRQFGPEHVEILEKFAIGESKSFANEQARTGFLAGDHLLDYDFDLEKNVFGDALHFAVRIDTNQVPAAIRRAWLQIELATLTADSVARRPTKAQRQEAKDAVEARCEEAAGSGQFQRLQQFPVLWDAKNSLLYCGGTSASASEVCSDLMIKAFELELSRLSSGKLALEWAVKAKQRKALNDALPASFRGDVDRADVVWWDGEKDNYDFLGNEFLLWLWWRWETQGGTIGLSDDSEVTGMFARTLALECPQGESGKGTIAAEDPTYLPEAAQAIRTGKLPRKAGLILVRHGEQYELTLQAETFAVSGAKIQIDEDAEGRGILEDRIEGLRGLKETLDLLYQAFCEQRIGKDWKNDLDQMRGWLKTKPRARRT